jgi:hypothetical protein
MNESDAQIRHQATIRRLLGTGRTEPGQWLVAVVGAVFVVIVASPAGAAEDPSFEGEGTTYGFDLRSEDVEEADEGVGETFESGPTGQPTPGRLVAAAPPEPEFFSEESYFSVDEDGAECVAIRRVPDYGTPQEALDALAETAERMQQAPLCPADQAEDGAPATTMPTAESVVAALWRGEVPLPDPLLHIAPGYAVTGLPAFVDIEGPQEIPYGPVTRLGWTVTMGITSEYGVDWGDGTVVRVDSQGGPWPDGDVWHNYMWADADNVVTVRQYWVASFRAEGYGRVVTGDLTNPLITQAALPLAIREIQAVLN